MHAERMSDTLQVDPGGPVRTPPTALDLAADADAAGADAAPDTPAVRSLLRLREALDALPFQLRTATAEPAGQRRDELLHQIDDYLVPRLRRLDAPLLAVIGGSTGAGKSTIVNSLLRVEVSRTGVLRPTTRSPVLVHHPADGEWFADRRVLPGLARDYGADVALAPGDPITSMRLVASDAVPHGLAVLDAPDIDSVVASNRVVAAQLLAAADLWLFVTTAARYADAVPWSFLGEAAERSTALCVVLNRVPADAVGEVRQDLAGLLAANGLGASPVFTIAEGEIEAGLMPRDAVAPLAEWLAGIARDGASRALVVRRTLGGALASLRIRADQVADAADEQAATAARLRDAAEGAHRAAAQRFDDAVSDGTLLRGEVLARWQEVVGTGDLMRQVESGIGRTRDRVVAFVRGRPAPAQRLGETLGSATQTLVTARVTAATAETARLWSAEPAGAEILAARPGLDGVPPDLTDRITRLVRDWQAGVLDLVRELGAGKRRTARALSLGVNGAGVVLMLYVFTRTGGLTGAEAGVAAGTAALSQRVLEAVFGDQAVRDLAAKAHRDLLRRVGDLLDDERDRWTDAVPAVRSGAALRAVAADLRSDL
jgi:energy-coupling factor transporter ATP-binding protein EcfA2